MEKNEYLSCSVEIVDNKVKIKGNIASASNYIGMVIKASNPIDRMTTYTGSGLPFPCHGIAFEGTPNEYKIPDNGIFETTFSYPNTFYDEDYTKLIPPCIFFILQQKNKEPLVFKYELANPLPVRSLTYRPRYRTGPQFYSMKEELVTMQGAEGTMRTIAKYKGKYDIAI